MLTWMTKILLDIEDNVWMAFKKSVPRDVKFPDAVCLLIIHYIDMRESGKTLMKVLMEKYGIEKKQIKAKFLTVLTERL